MKKKFLIGTSAALIAGAVFLLAHRPLNAPAEESQPAATPSGAATEPTPALPGTPASGGQGPRPMSREEFQELTATVANAIPSQAELRKLPPEEVHMTPRVLQIAGFQLGRVAEALAANPQLAGEGMRFYESCVRAETNPTSVRALCLSDYEHLAEAAHLPARDDLAPAHIRDLAEKLNGF